MQKYQTSATRLIYPANRKQQQQQLLLTEKNPATTHFKTYTTRAD